ncbi:MAG: glutamyl-tRNA reductase [Thermaerobacter sp.]|nr:glutamyl-tRNA reductase [Thermaerobacter sp.]
MKSSWTMIGLTHRDAGVDVRGRLSLEHLAEAVYRDVLETAKEVLVLSTCNRSEVYAFGKADDVDEAIRASWKRNADAAGELLNQHAQRLEGRDAVEHLFLVAAGLDAQIVGETQILGQLKEAFADAAAAGAVGKELSMAVQAALAAARRAHRETGLDAHPVSVGAAAVALGRQAFGDLTGKTVLMIGAGEVAELCLTHLREAGATDVVVSNRTRERAEELAHRFGGRAAGWEESEDWLRHADLVLSSTSAPHTILYARDLRRILRARRDRQMILIDLAVPRDIETRCGQIPGVFLYDLDNLAEITASSRAERLREAKHAQEIVVRAAADYHRRTSERAAVPLIQSLRGKADRVRDDELQRAFRRLGDVAPDERRVIEQLASRIVNKLLNDPTVALKECAAREDADACLRLAARLFHLDGQEWPQQA